MWYLASFWCCSKWLASFLQANWELKSKPSFICCNWLYLSVRCCGNKGNSTMMLPSTSVLRQQPSVLRLQLSQIWEILLNAAGGSCGFIVWSWCGGKWHELLPTCSAPRFCSFTWLAVDTYWNQKAIPKANKPPNFWLSSQKKLFCHWLSKDHNKRKAN